MALIDPVEGVFLSDDVDDDNDDDDDNKLSYLFCPNVWNYETSLNV